MIQFNELGLAELILRAVSDEGYTTPTPIQAKVIPDMMNGRDILGTAQTGTGKTAAFVLPILERIAERIAGSHPRPAPKHSHALIVAPTRELTAQIADSIRTYGRHVRPSVAVIVGGLKPGPQIKAMARGVDIIVATPGRLLDHMSTGAIRLDQCSIIVLDEADQMMDLGFLPAIRKIMAKLPRERQVALLSATMPKQIRALANDFLKAPSEIAVAAVAKPIEKINQKVVMVDRAAKQRMLTELLTDRDVERAIVFTRTKRGADKVCRSLENAGLSAAAIHGNKSQPQRQKTLDGFKAGRVKILVATDIAARGIDVDGVSHVVNFEMPNVPEAYVHRIGRTARAGKSGIAISLCDNSESGMLRDIERLIGAKLNAKQDAGYTGTDKPAPGTRGGGANNRNGGGNRNGGNGSGGRNGSGARNGSGQARRGAAPKQSGKEYAAKRNQRKKTAKPGGGSNDGAGLNRMLGA
ncbi:MAG: DEAD/DEAH box helicase [Rhodospirillaceae bacterium]|nr:DEAD/DEAH box helicase [Rhodospirillaceae bacterium]MBT5808879.1 DEAD/DEAH box helicase [Rhodospirillaceae bacterium]